MTSPKTKPVSFILDCSVSMAWCFEDEIVKYSEAVFDALNNETALVPAIWPLEVANVLLIAERKKRINPIKSISFKEALRMLPIQIDHTTSQRALGSIMEVAKEVGITAYDAAYLELALHSGLPLSTLDLALKKAAHKVGVPLYKID